jgi:hypothetical protein
MGMGAILHGRWPVYRGNGKGDPKAAPSDPANRPFGHLDHLRLGKSAVEPESIWPDDHAGAHTPIFP